MNGAPLTSKSGEGYGVLFEVCCTTQSGKRMIQVSVVFRFSHTRLFDTTDRPSGNLEGLKLTHSLEHDTYSSRRTRGIIMLVFLQIVVFLRKPKGLADQF